MAEEWNGQDKDEVIGESEREDVRGRADEADEFDELTEDEDDEEDLDDEKIL